MAGLQFLSVCSVKAVKVGTGGVIWPACSFSLCSVKAVKVGTGGVIWPACSFSLCAPLRLSRWVQAV